MKKLHNHNKPEYIHLLTRRQWAEKGKIVNDGASGTEMWTNNHHGVKCTYYSEDETHNGTVEELETFWRPIKEELKRKARLREEEKRKRLTEYWELKDRCQYLENILKVHTVISENFDNMVNAYTTFIQNTVSNQINTNLIVIDVETTGLNADENEILQLSIIDGNGKTLYNQYFKPIIATEWTEAEKINGISLEKVSECSHIYSEFPNIIPIIASAKVIVGYNIYFDLSFLSAVGIKFDKNCTIVDIMREFAPIYGEWNDYFGDYKWQKLTTCANYFGYDWKNDKAHDSLSDCRATLFCYYAMRKHQK